MFSFVDYFIFSVFGGLVALDILAPARTFRSGGSKACWLRSSIMSWQAIRPFSGTNGWVSTG